ncbi:hypothetical protein Sfulv_07450 [Streptomyces fulvorobeus]|uniref:Uncharacterized protein n=1 Tax=Streptomyces fulvorobeus TaxID=284028 RepID=A0A7J0C1U9_9ACTN|nr:hypothetical protein Sfulv_07450 [Streptomyces fulvorobeus]
MIPGIARKCVTPQPILPSRITRGAGQRLWRLEYARSELCRHGVHEGCGGGRRARTLAPGCGGGAGSRAGSPPRGRQRIPSSFRTRVCAAVAEAGK